MEVAAAAAAAGPSYRGEVQEKTRPDSFRRPTGHSLTLEKNVVDVKQGSSVWPFFPLPSLSPSHILTFPDSLLPCLAPAIIPKQRDTGWESSPLKLMRGYDGVSLADA